MKIEELRDMHIKALVDVIRPRTPCDVEVSFDYGPVGEDVVGYHIDGDKNRLIFTEIDTDLSFDDTECGYDTLYAIAKAVSELN